MGVDELIKKTGIPLVSRCRCCGEHEEESIDHLFVKGELAANVWRYISEVFYMPFPENTSIFNLASLWFTNSKGRPFFHYLMKMVPMLILWEVWLERNRRNHENIFLSPSEVTRKVIRWLKELAPFCVVKRICNFQENLSLSQMGINDVEVTSPSVIFTRWLKPQRDKFK